MTPRARPSRDDGTSTRALAFDTMSTTRTWIAPGIAALVLLAIAWPTAHTELELGGGTSLVVGLATALPAVLVVASPARAWLLSLLGVLVLAVTVIPPAWHQVPFPAVHAVVLLLLLGVVTVRCEGWLVAAAAAGTVAGAVVVAVLHSTIETVLLSAQAVIAVLVVGLLVRAILRSRRALAVSEEISERERARSAVLEERARIARELHDVVAHSMSMIVVRAETARYRLPGLGDDATGELTEIADAARRSLGEVRGVLGVLRGTEPDEQPVEPPQPTLDDVDRLLDDTTAAGVLLHVTQIGDRSATGAATAVCLYRILAEALANASRHAAGAPVEVTVDHRRDAVRVDVANGPGRDAGPGGGLGLPGMRDRASVLGGDLDAGPTPDGGFAVRARLPTAVGVPA